MTIADKLENIEFMVETREHPDRIATRIGTTPAGLRRFLLRQGRKDLTAYLEEPPQPVAMPQGRWAFETAPVRSPDPDRHWRRDDGNTMYGLPNIGTTTYYRHDWSDWTYEGAA